MFQVEVFTGADAPTSVYEVETAEEVEANLAGLVTAGFNHIPAEKRDGLALTIRITARAAATAS